MSKDTTIKCPDCGSEIDVNEILKPQIEEGLRQEFLKDKKELEKMQAEKEEALAKKEAEFEAKKKKENELFQEPLEKQAKEDKITLARIWKTREKQIDKVVDNAIGMHASIKGIAGNAIQSIPALEMVEELEEESKEIL